MTSTPKLPFLILCLCLVSSCGQTGALYMPEKSDADAKPVSTTRNADPNLVTRKEQ